MYKRCMSQAFSLSRTWLIDKWANSTHVYQNCVHLNNHEHVERKNSWQSNCLPPDSEPEAGSGLNQNQGASQKAPQKHKRMKTVQSGDIFSLHALGFFSVYRKRVCFYFADCWVHYIFNNCLRNWHQQHPGLHGERGENGVPEHTHSSSKHQATSICATKKHCTLIARFNWPLLTAEW